MQTLILYEGFEKKENSTKRPSTGTTRYIQGILKEPCSLMTPVIKIERLPNDVIPGNYTYARWVQANRYYFIEDWVWANGLWEVHMKEDVLATFKTEIGNSTEYVLRTDSTTDFNGEITDTTYPATTDVQTETVGYPNVFTPNISNGCYIVGIISGNNTQAVGAISYYLMTSAQFGALKDKLLSDDNLITMGLAVLDPSSGALTPTITDISLELLKTMYNPYQYIVSCMWFPFMESLIVNKTAVTSIKIGWWDYPLNGYRLYAQTVSLVERNITFQQHPQANTRGSYLNYAPYSKRYLMGRFGTVPLDSFSFKVGDTIELMYVIDLITGQCRVEIGRIRGQDFDLLTDKHFLLGVPIQLAQVGVDYLGTAVNAINTIPQAIGGAISGIASGKGAIMGAIAGAASGVYNTIQSAMPQVETSGTNGSFLTANYETYSVSQFFKIVDEDIAHRGRPLCELRQINTLSGFILCSEGEIDISCYDNERKEIVRYLTEGFFWE
jgi:hypothetical protein